MVEHAVGIYIGLLLLACVVAIVSKMVTQLPYTIFLTLVGLLIGVLGIGPEIEETGFGHDLIFFVFLPPLLFQGAFHMNLNSLLEQFWPIVCFAVPGVIASTLLVGGVVGWLGGIGSMMVAILFGALISPTDPVSVLSLFKEVGAPEDLKTIVEGESLFNDATGVVLFTILLEALLEGQGFGFGQAVVEFVKVSVGGILLGAVLGWIVFKIMRHIEDHLLENALCLVLAYGSFWLAEGIHLSGVIGTVMAGLMIGNYGRRLSMSEKTTQTVETFFESISFLINSLLFILIGLELREVPADIVWMTALVAIAAMLIGRAAVSYSFYWLLNQVGTRRPKKWKHILFWGGLRGSIPIALLLQLPNEGVLVTWRPVLLASGFACVFFSMVVQGTTMKPLIRKLGI
ncbi:MAG: sodium:proton antiporter [Deltaproteobacteria bacterium]|nr:sodium:proton antiporter [Deltaproteobacteria bacterium]MBW1957576.1 sodium:proton antiporter [Deltaproteobacteria bacterium]MBW2013125.1 sodium:proton antiporter [Deltaproteobacteria bacterium]MBW2088094.1 sodium:proton antiporter [Deltaproteobacteria bacterium]MBW2319514.1 sodium:proton antiporter [Deltaproteobacteria bacterium]